MATPTLSAGAIKKTYDTGDVSDHPTLQIWDVKRIGDLSLSLSFALSLPQIKRAQTERKRKERGALLGVHSTQPHTAHNAQVNRTKPPATNASGAQPSVCVLVCLC